MLRDLRHVRPDLIVHGAACPWGHVAANELDVPAVSVFTTMAFGPGAPSPTRPSAELLAKALARPRSLLGYARARALLARRHRTRGLPLVDLVNVRQPLNLVFTSRAFQPGAGSFARTYRFVGPSVGARPHDPAFPLDGLRAPVLYASLGTVFDAGPRALRGSPPHSRRSAAPWSSPPDAPTPRPSARSRTTCSPAASFRSPTSSDKPRCSSPTGA